MSAKQRILERLEQCRGQSVSGAALAEELGVSRTAVWKAVRSLQKDGYLIDAVRNKGYLLRQENDKLSLEGIKPYLDDPDMIGRIAIYDTLASTNLTAKKLALDGAPSGTAVLANTQTQGRGRLGRSFYSPPDAGLYFSQILRPSIPAEDSVLITTAASVAVCRAIESVTGLYPLIKWVNDIYLDGKKICGILTEAVTNIESGEIASVVIGIGINVSAAAFPPELSAVAGALYQTRPAAVSRNRLAAGLFNQLQHLPEMVQSRSYLPEYRQRSLVLGKRIRILGQAEQLADVLDIDSDGGLVVRLLADGRRAVLKSGEISIRLTE